jgi:hypothetical protein
MTGYMTADPNRMDRNAEKVITVAKSAEITSVLFTGKGEPMMDESRRYLFSLLKTFKIFPCELQTNGRLIAENPDWLDQLYMSGLDVLALSIDTALTMAAYTDLWKRLRDLDMVGRITVNVTNKLLEFDPIWWINQCQQYGIQQLTFRRITIPEKCIHQPTKKWILENAPDDLYWNIVEKVNQLVKTDGRLIRNLKNGVKIWDVNDIAIATSDYCIQERDDGDNLRSLVFQEDGHLYTGWGSKASILF